MPCPRCETPLTTYNLESHEASACERCGYVGVSVEHRPEPLEFESWEEALRRFRRGGEDESR